MVAQMEVRLLSPEKAITNSDYEPVGDTQEEFIDFEKLFSIARRQWFVVAVSVFVFLLLGIAYLLTAVPQFTATTSVLIDRGNSEILNQLANMGVQVDDDGAILSEVELFKSDTVGLAVVDKLNLLDNPVFMSAPPSLSRMIRSAVDFRRWFSDGGDGAVDQDLRRIKAASNLANNMDVERTGKSYALSISYTSTSPELAANIADSIANAYLLDKLNSKYDATRRASDWLQKRIDELRQKALDSDLAVQKFRSEHGLVAVSTNGSSLLVSDQQLSELNSALITAQSDTAKAQAKYDRVKAIIDSGKTDAIVTDVLDSSISNDLRKKYLEASKFESELEARVGADHIQAVRLRGEMAEYKRLMFEELNRIAESYQSELEVAQTRERSLADSVAHATGISSAANETQVQLRELERNADTYKNLYQTFLTRFQEATQQQSFPITESRIITKAQIPTRPSSPKKPLIIALAIFAGAAFGGGIGAYREFRDRFFRTGEQVRDELGMEYIGHVPLMSEAELAPPPASSGSPRDLNDVSLATRYVVNHPLSAFAETLRSAKLAVDMANPGKRCKIIGIISSLPGEGKSTVSINFAQLLAMQGSRTLLIDGDLRNPGATRAIGRHAENGIIETLLDKRPIRDSVLVDSKTKLAFVAAVVKRRIPHSSDLLSSPLMANLLEEMSGFFDYIVIDLPPLGPVVDAKAVGPMLDASLAVIEWGHTSRRVVRSTFGSHPELIQKCLGVILNKVDTAKLKLYHSYGSGEYYYSRYSAYYHEA